MRDEHPLFVRLGRHAHEDPVALSAEAVYRLVHRHCLVAGVPDRLAHPHALRSYWATHCLEAGVSVHEVREPTPNRRSWPAFQTVGEQLLRDGWRGLLAPSAARPGALNRDSERPGEMDVIVRKNRQGRLGQVTTLIDKRLRYHRVLAQNVGDTAPF